MRSVHEYWWLKVSQCHTAAGRPSTGEMHASLECGRYPSHPQGLFPPSAEVQVPDDSIRSLSITWLLILWQAAARRSKKEMGHLLGDHYETSSVWGFPLYPHALSTQLSCWAINYWLLLGLTEWGHLRCVEMQVGKIHTSDACELHRKAITT